MAARIKIGEWLVRAKLIDQTQLSVALAEQRRWGGKLGDILVRMNLVSEDALMKVLSTQLGVPCFPLDSVESIPGSVKALIPRTVATKMRAVPLGLNESKSQLHVAMEEPQNLKQLDELRAVTQLEIIPFLAAPSAIARALTRFYGETTTAEPAPTVELNNKASISPEALLHQVEVAQKHEVATLKGLIDILIEKGVFTKEEYVAKYKKYGP